MADIFISYSKADRDLADKLATALEADGWTVWWDKSLAAGDAFRDQIMKELTAARAVIAIWTRTSIQSDWVRAEAGRAKADCKLIPVKAPELTYPDIPLPFGEMHTEDVGAHDLIRAAVVAQLAKPQVAPSAVWTATKTVRLQALTWAGIVGGSVTVFANLRELLNLADWARWLVTHWQDLTQGFWTAMFGWIGIRLSPLLVPNLSFALFIAMIAIGTTLRSSARGANRATTDGAGGLTSFVKWTAAYLAYLACAGVGFFVANETGIEWNPVLTVSVLLVVVFAIPMGGVVWVSKQRSASVALMAFLVLFWVMLVAIPTTVWVSTLEEGVPSIVQSDVESFLVASLLMYVSIPMCAIALVAFSPVGLVNQRLLFLSLGAAMLIALNQVSALGVHGFIAAPKG